MTTIKGFDEFTNESHEWDRELEDARMMRGSAEGLTSWAERKIAESRPENFKEGIIDPVQEELTLPINELDINDPVLVAARAMKDAIAKKKVEQAANKKKRLYGKRREMVEFNLWDISQELKELYAERSDLLTDMESEAGEMGMEEFEKKDRHNFYGSELDRIEAHIEKLKKLRDDLETKLSY
jgi:hypothetical protein